MRDAREWAKEQAESCSREIPASANKDQAYGWMALQSAFVAIEKTFGQVLDQPAGE